MQFPLGNLKELPSEDSVSKSGSTAEWINVSNNVSNHSDDNVSNTRKLDEEIALKNELVRKLFRENVKSACKHISTTEKRDQVRVSHLIKDFENLGVDSYKTRALLKQFAIEFKGKDPIVKTFCQAIYSRKAYDTRCVYTNTNRSNSVGYKIVNALSNRWY